jgi:hypothetical protein
MKFKRKSFENSEDGLRERVITKFLFFPKTLYVGKKDIPPNRYSRRYCKYEKRQRQTRWLSKEKIIQYKIICNWEDDGWAE